jgi:hypothetical protein
MSTWNFYVARAAVQMEMHLRFSAVSDETRPKLIKSKMSCLVSDGAELCDILYYDIQYHSQISDSVTKCELTVSTESSLRIHSLYFFSPLVLQYVHSFTAAVPVACGKGGYVFLFFFMSAKEPATYTT